jgi:anti-sigma regulatory factor (Ser/Thr protein kinase)
MGRACPGSTHASLPDKDSRSWCDRDSETVSWEMQHAEAAGADTFRHVALFYRSLTEYRARVAAFARAGVARREPVLLAVPGHAFPDLARGDKLMTLADVRELGRNPARIIPVLRTFADSFRGRPVRIVSELIWPGRSAAEMREGARNESLVDQALAGIPGTLVCPYSADLPAPVLADAACAHAWELGLDSVVASGAYSGPGATPAQCQGDLPSPPATATTIEYASDLRPLRALVASAATNSGLGADRATDMTIAVNEVAANTLRHTAGGGTVTAWHADGEMLCEISDTGYIPDPLAGLRRPSLDEPGGQGLWLVNQICDLVELRSTTAGTTVRLHMRLDGQ